MKSLKEKALDKILLGVSLKLILSTSLGLLYPHLHENFNSDYYLVLAWKSLIFILQLVRSAIFVKGCFCYNDNLILAWKSLICILQLVGYVIFVKGCFLYVESKGYSSKRGWLGILGLFTLPLFFFLPSKKDKTSVESDNSEDGSFEQINILEILLSIYIGIPILISFISRFIDISILRYVIHLTSFSYKYSTESILRNIILWIVYAIALLAKMKEFKFDINQIIGIDNSINLKSILVITITLFAFNIGLSCLMLYQLSFIFPKYVEHLINDREYTNLLEMVLWCFSIMFFSPLIQEFLFRGVVMQKWVLKWGIKIGIIASSLLFALLPFRYDLIIPMFVFALICSILYFKNNNLISPIISHFFYNTLAINFNSMIFFLTPETERNVFVSVEVYQDYFQSLLNPIIFLIAVSASFIIYFIYKNFPRNNAIIPYYANLAKIHETS